MVGLSQPDGVPRMPGRVVVNPDATTSSGLGNVAAHPRILHTITSLDVGGAEASLARLIHAMPVDIPQHIVCLKPLGVVAERINGRTQVETVGLTSVVGLPLAITRLRTSIRRFRPDVVISWMYHADLLAGLALRGSHIPLVWNLRAYKLEPQTRPSTRLLVKLNGLLAGRLPDLVIANSEAAAAAHQSAGYRGASMRTIPNGVTIPAVDADRRSRLRADIGVDDEVFVIGRIGRYAPVKDHAMVIQAAARVRSMMDRRTVLVLCGRDLNRKNIELMNDLRRHDMIDDAVLLGERDDASVLPAAFDVACSSSLNEAFPNVVAEAMALGVPVVATDVGGTREVMGGHGTLIPARDARAMADALAAVLRTPESERDRLGEDARRWIVTAFSMDAMCRSYLDLAAELTV